MLAREDAVSAVSLPCLAAGEKRRQQQADQHDDERDPVL